jgi:ectoine hydroxylase-related dioxygenase (phytanoyl-CoA dioxygenase family)
MPNATHPMTPSDLIYAHGDHGSIADGVARDGVAVVRKVLSESLQASLRMQIMHHCAEPEIEAGGSVYDLCAVERLPAMLELLTLDAFMGLYRRLLGGAEMVVHRSASIVRQVGSPAVAWHSDYDFSLGEPQRVDGVLNRGEWPNGMWFYLTGTHPHHGGLSVIRHSHGEHWTPPSPWRLSSDRHLLLGPQGQTPGMDVPGAIPIHAEPGDLIIFAARTYHAAYPLDDAPRISCSLCLRPRSTRIKAPWQRSLQCQDFLRSLPSTLAPWFDGYVGIDPAWTAGDR